jgi:pyruvate dehydrogenase E2 component (dihydrolipoamide acetyltransferase)
MQEGTLIRWLRNEGESINKGDVLAEIETDKATVEVESSASGVIRQLLVDQGTVVPIGTPIAIVGTKDEQIEAPATTAGSGKVVDAERPGAAMPAPAAHAPPAVGPVAAVAGQPVKASPLARRMADEAHLDLGTIAPSGPGGRVVRRDIEAAVSGRTLPAAAPPLAYAAPPVATGPRVDEELALSKLRMAIGRRMTESKSNVPHFYVTHEYR